MNFDNYHLVSMLAREHQQALIEEAAERRMLRLAKQSHPSRSRLSRMFRQDPAS